MHSQTNHRDRFAIRRMLAVGAGLGFLLLAGHGAGAQSGGGDPKPVLEAMQKAMGGKKNWEKARFIRFDWVVERDGKEAAHVAHLMDRWDGRYRVEWKNREGKFMQALFNSNTKQGHMWVDGQPAPDTLSAQMMERAYGRFINDSYWLLMPWKMDDPKVMLTRVGPTTMDGQDYDVLHLAFDHVGLTPGDQYWAYINRKTHLMDRWAYFLQDEKGVASLDSATAWAWSDWTKTGNIMLSRDRRKVGPEAGRIHFPVCEVLAKVDDRVFDSIATPMPAGAPPQP